MIDFEIDRSPLIIAVAGPNGAGKTNFFDAFLAQSALRFVNADVLAARLATDGRAAARLANALRRALVDRRESFIFETVFSDPVGDKIAFLEDAAQRGYTVVLCYIGLSNPEQSVERVGMRVSQGGHNVPDDKLRSRFPRTLANLREALVRLPHVLIYDNSNLAAPYRKLAVFDNGQVRFLSEPVPDWLRTVLA
jgi:predicted ABC-type ATPase